MSAERTRTDSGAGRVWGRLADMTPLSTGLPLDERYLLIEQLGTGGMSVVWRGFDDVLGRPVAVKVLSPPTAADPAFRAAIRKEARAAARLSHPNITQVYDYGETTLPGGPTVSYVVMELLSGQTLGQRLVDGALPWREALDIAAQVAGALAAAHRRGIVHRDIAPANVMLTAGGVKVVDFGIAALAGGRGDPDGGGLLGTPAYVAPERLDDAPAAPAADVYALGALLYELLAGATPIAAKTWPALVDAYRDGFAIPPLTVPGLPPQVPTLILRCLDPDPAERPGTAELARALLAALNEIDPPAAVGRPAGMLTATRHLPVVEQMPPPPLSRRPALLIAGAAVILLLAAILFVIGQLVIRTEHGTPGAVAPSLPAVQPGPTGSAAASATPSRPASPSPSTTHGGTTAARPTVNPLSVVDQLISNVQAGADAGEIRADVALDLENVLHQLRTRIIQGERIDYPTTASGLRTKIALRINEAAITESRGMQLITLINQLSGGNP